jgi:Ni/Co efflux regulator RcnB
MRRIQGVLKLSLGLLFCAGTLSPGQTAPNWTVLPAAQSDMLQSDMLQSDSLQSDSSRRYWAYGDVVPSALRIDSFVVKDRNAHTLYMPSPGQEWLHLGMQFLLVRTADGKVSDLADDRP